MAGLAPDGSQFDERQTYDAEKKVLVDIVKLAQKKGLKGAKGDWKEFLSCFDHKFGASLSDPARRSTETLTAFLETFSQQEDLELFSKIIRRHENVKAMQRLDCESPQQKLVRLTLDHPLYAQHYTFPSHNEDWMILPLGEVSENMISVDCEMVLCQDGTNEVVKVCAVDHNLEVKLDTLVRPNKPISDFRTAITGLSSEDMADITCSLLDVQESLRNLLSHGTILVGHSLHNDLQALKIEYAWVIDTSYIFRCVNMPTFLTPSLNSLCKSVLGNEVRKVGDKHNCLADAKAAMKLVLAKIEHGFDAPIEVDGKKVTDADLAKLLLHRVPVDVPVQDLLKLFSESCDISIQSELRICGQYYSTYAIFKDKKEAFKAFEKIYAQEEKDYRGRTQKLVYVSSGNDGKTVGVYVRKMVPDESPGGDAFYSKRGAETAADGGLKRQKMILHPCGHLEEIERLKRELQQREEEIYTLQKALSKFLCDK